MLDKSLGRHYDKPIPCGGMKMSNEESKLQKNIITRLKKIEGQVRGIQRMVENDNSCSDILIQVSAVKSALNNTGLLIFENYAQDCFKSSPEGYDEDSLKELMKTLSLFTR